MNEFSPELDLLVDECLEAVLQGSLTVEQCLQRYPQQAHALKPLLQVAVLTARLKSPQMTVGKMTALEDRLRAQMNIKQTPSKIIVFQPLARAAAAIVIVCLLIFGSGAGLVAASDEALPGDTLYTVKRFWESIVLVIASFTGRLDETWLEIAGERLWETEMLAAQGQLTETALLDLYTATTQAISTSETSDNSDVIAYLARAKDVLLLTTPPDNLKLLYEDVLAMMTGSVDASGVLHTPPDTPPSVSGFPLTETPTITPTLTLEITPTATSTPTLTLTSPTLTYTPSPTRTPTPSRTPTITPSITPTPTLTPTYVTPTYTWTPLPIPPRVTLIPTIPPLVTSTLVPGITPVELTDLPPVFIRETQQSVYLTQTAGPPITNTPTP